MPTRNNGMPEAYDWHGESDPAMLWPDISWKKVLGWLAFAVWLAVAVITFMHLLSCAPAPRMSLDVSHRKTVPADLKGYTD